MAYINMNMKNDMYNTPLPNAFIDNYMPYSNPTYSTIYIYAFRYCFSGNKSLTTKDIANVFKILESDVINAWKYWEDKKLVTLNIDNENNMIINFISPVPKNENKDSIKKLEKNFILDQKPIYSIKELEIYKENSKEIYDLFLYAEKCLQKQLTPTELSTIFSLYDWLRFSIDVIKILLDNYCSNNKDIKYIENIAIYLANNEIKTKEKVLEYIGKKNNTYLEKNIEPKKKLVLDNKPIYPPKELEIYKNNAEEVNRLFSLAEKILGKLLTSNDLSTLFSFYDWLGLPIDTIEILLEHCALNDHKNMRYIETVAIDWVECGINTKEKALEYIKVYHKDFKEIMKSFGQNNRNPTKKEIEFMKKWLYQYNMPLNIILEACDKTIMQIGQPKFNYTDKIINEWYLNGVKNINDIKNLERKFKKEKNLKTKPQNININYKKNKFINYEQPNVNFDELEKLEFEYLNNNLKGK